MPPRALALRQAQTVAAFLAILAAWYATHDYRYAEDMPASAESGWSTAPVCEGAGGVLAGSGPSLAMLATLKHSDPQSKAGVRQRNALRSWRAMFPHAELYFAGGAPAALARELGAVRGPRLPRFLRRQRGSLAACPRCRPSCTECARRSRERRC